jgi:hypothetical protein
MHAPDDGLLLKLSSVHCAVLHAGRGRGVVAKDHVAPGSLLFVSEPVGPVLKAPAGQQLGPVHLLQHWQSVKGGLSPTARWVDEH